ncbi:MAG: hypothetical protein QOJ64_528 [Acidobacteriota bacterium]|nr:hypothetical protein [Acidobacteriota bacterium]
MKRSLLFAASLVLCLLSLTFFSAFPSGAVKADPPDPCVRCQQKVQHDFEKCEAKFGVSQFCYDQFNNGIIACYATVCEQ